jgi:SpoIID/LytB domain protein
MNEPKISIGILFEKSIKFELHGNFRIKGSQQFLSGICKAKVINDKIELTKNDTSFQFENEILLVPSNHPTEHFTLRDVIIGVKFHWERKEKQSFKGWLKLLRIGNKIHAINIVPLEEYLTSVISSEMSAKGTLQLLKAHAIVSRSWVMAQLVKAKKIKKENLAHETEKKDNDELIRWYDREDHEHFDVCADDHCQRYQGITKIYTDISKQAVNQTRGLVLMNNDEPSEICDARFSKSCGGISEAFENVWEPVHHDYLIPVVDYKYEPENYTIDFSKERNARKWILYSPPAFCNTTDKQILSQVLIDYDQETTDFFRWKVEYNQTELTELIKEKSGIDFGDILDFIPIQRGASARLIKLKVIGTKKTFIIGKELEIRKLLSKTHLYSSAIVFDKMDEVNGVPQKFVLHGAGWGHGVGLCQIGAALMAQSGFFFDEILSHYYKNTTLKKNY